MLPPLCQRRRLQRVVLSRLNRTALALAVYASSSPLRCRRRKTRFRWLARPCRVGLVTHRVPTKGFRDHSSISSSFPELPWRNDSLRMRFSRNELWNMGLARGRKRGRDSFPVNRCLSNKLNGAENGGGKKVSGTNGTAACPA